MLTKRQKQIVDFITTYTKKHGFAPLFSDICKRMNLRSLATVHQHISALEQKGYVERQKRRARSIIASTKEKMFSIPLLGIIAAGQPIEAIENKETIAVPQSRLPFPVKDCYALRVAGNSMIEEHINDGDFVLVKKQETARNGEKVVALLDNSEVTLKKFYREKNHIRLQPANKDFEPIIVTHNRSLTIQGIVVDVIRGKAPTATVFPKVKTEITEYAKLPLNRIILGDALVEIKKLPSVSCDIIIADPPYNIGKDFGNNFDKREMTEYIKWCKSWIDECIRVMRPNGTMFIYGFSEILAYLSVEIPLQKRWLIWHYTNKNVASLNFWQRSHEAIICAWKGRPIFNRDEVREPYTDGFLNGAAGKVRKGTLGRFSSSGIETVYNAHERGALPRDVIKVPALAGGAGMTERWFLCKTCGCVYEPRQLKNHEGHEIMKHPTQKPFELSRKLIKSATPKKDGVVLVPFVGTGSECAVARQLGQSYIGFEINPDYIKIAQTVIAFKL